MRTHLWSAGTTYHGASSVDVASIAYVVRRLVRVPLAARVEVGGVELPPLLGIVDPGLEPLALLVLRDVQEHLHDRGALRHEQMLEVAHHPHATPAFLVVDEAEHEGGDDVLVVRPVEDPDLARPRRDLVHAPEEVVRRFDVVRRLERDDPATLRVHTAEDVADRAVLARRVESLQHEQHAALLLAPQVVLEHRQPLDVRAASLSSADDLSRSPSVAPGFASSGDLAAARSRSRIDSLTTSP